MLNTNKLTNELKIKELTVLKKPQGKMKLYKKKFMKFVNEEHSAFFLRGTADTLGYNR